MFSLIEPIESIVDRLSLYRFACLDMGSKSIKNMPVRQRTLPYPPRPANRLVNIAAKNVQICVIDNGNCGSWRVDLSIVDTDCLAPPLQGR
jgi:hypothetical protein